jgi:hypothetical protein
MGRLLATIRERFIEPYGIGWGLATILRFVVIAAASYVISATLYAGCFLVIGLFTRNIAMILISVVEFIEFITSGGRPGGWPLSPELGTSKWWLIILVMGIMRYFTFGWISGAPRVIPTSPTFGDGKDEQA